MKTGFLKPLGAMVAAAFVFLGADGALAQVPAKIPVEAFFQNPTFRGGKLSPNGRHVALAVAHKNGRVQLVVLDAQNVANAKVVGGFSNADVGRFEWVNDNRLVFTVTDLSLAQGDVRYGAGLFAVDKDGGDFRQMAEMEAAFWQGRRLGDRELLDVNARLYGTTRDKKSDDVFVLLPVFKENSNRDFESWNIVRVNTRTRAVARQSRPGKSIAWVVDAQDVPRASVTADDDRIGVHYLDPATEKWQQLAEFNRFGGKGFEPVAVGPDGTLYVVGNTVGNDKDALFRYDLTKKAVDPEPILALPGFDFSIESTLPSFDFNSGFIMDSKRLLGLRYESDAMATIWFDPAIKAIQNKIDGLLPGTVNVLDVPLRSETPFVLVHSFSDADPGSYLLFNTETGKFAALGSVQPTVEAKQMARKDIVRYKARDGMEIPAWLTLPKGAKGKKVPLVVLVHGGPWVRGGHWTWDAESQFLASRGYAVLEPEFRGSTGYGFSHFHAGWKQWGLAMQNDVADGARWAVAQGMVDPARICIAGASYGGYATLMGLVNDPELYKCGINWVGVTDIDLMYSVVWSDFSDVHKTFGMPLLVGDRQKDAAQLKATSPLLQAARIKQPLLLAYGGADQRVPIVHGVKFRDAVQKTNADVEWAEYTDEGHGWRLVKNRVDFWTRVEKFLDKHIGAK
jgi:acetyl esterase/lipase